MADPRGGGTAADEMLGCSQFEKPLHLQSASTTSPRNVVSQGVRSTWCTQGPLQPPLESRRR